MNLGGKLIGTPPPPTADRPRCPNCDKPLRPAVWLKSSGNFLTGEGRTKEWNGGYLGYGAFCSLKCCEQFANAAYRGGYRRVK